jgi:hypothetical protein
MDHVWARGRVSADECREALRKTWPMKNPPCGRSCRGWKRRDCLTHTTEGRTYIYQAAVGAGDGGGARRASHHRSVVRRVGGGAGRPAW